MSKSAKQANGMGSGFLGFNSKPPQVCVTSDDPEFDPTILSYLHQEGFRAKYLAYAGDARTYKDQLFDISENLELGESFAIVSYGDAAAACLDICIKPLPHLATLVAYYPSQIPSPKTKYPPHLEIAVHLAAKQGFAPAFNNYVYQDVDPGFAEHDLDEFDKISANLAWSRTLGALRKGFKVDNNLEKIWEEHMALEFMTKDAKATMATMIDEPYVNHIPTLTGGIGQKDLYRFYNDFFIPNNPPSTKVKLVSRTIGVDRVVDEMIFSFRHTQHVPWMLPDVPATNKEVQIALVSVVCIRGGKLYHEHIYWDQASVLVQVGLLDPKLVPGPFKQKGLKRLPVYGAETAQKVLDEESLASNELLSQWKPASSANGRS